MSVPNYGVGDGFAIAEGWREVFDEDSDLAPFSHLAAQIESFDPHEYEVPAGEGSMVFSSDWEEEEVVYIRDAKYELPENTRMELTGEGEEALPPIDRSTNTPWQRRNLEMVKTMAAWLNTEMQVPIDDGKGSPVLNSTAMKLARAAINGNREMGADGMAAFSGEGPVRNVDAIARMNQQYTGNSPHIQDLRG